jgi:chorismate synthase
MMLTYSTAGESHGKCLIALVEGLPHGLTVDEDLINAELARRQGGYGRGGRMNIESDRVQILTGVRKGHTIGSPVTLLISNRDSRIDSAPPVTQPRPGHADLAGMQKYGIDDARDILERASARETAARVAAGALARLLISEVGIEVVRSASRIR